MVKFSKDLSGVLLPHDHFGTHINSQGKTINTDLERKNFAHAGKLLAEIWSDTVIDGHPTGSEFIDGEPDIETHQKKCIMESNSFERKSILFTDREM